MSLRNFCRSVIRLRKAIVAILLLQTLLPAFAVEIRGVSLNRQLLEPGKNETLSVSFYVSEAANVRLSIYDDRNILVRAINSDLLAEGEHELQWDGRDNAGHWVPEEVYVYTLAATTAAGDYTEYDLTDITGQQRVGLENFSWLPQKKELDFYLIKPARVVVRAGLDNHGPLLKTLLNWQAFPFGKNTVHWDGLDESGVLAFGGSTNIQWAVDAFSLPDNHIFVINPDAQGFISELAWPLEYRTKKSNDKPTLYNPMQQPAEKRGDFPLSLTVLNAKEVDDESVITVSGKVLIRLDVPADFRTRIASQRFEPVFYVDGRFVFENEVGFFPMTFEWNSDNYNPGVHIITANLRGDRSNFGMASVKVRVTK